MRNELYFISSPKRLLGRCEQDSRSFVPILHAMLITLPAVATGRPAAYLEL